MRALTSKYYPNNNYCGWNTLDLQSGQEPYLETVWHSIDDRNNFMKAMHKKPSQMIYNEKSFTYKFNDHGYRCDDFYGQLESKFKILFVGDSITEGLGLPVEETWAYKLHHKLNEKYNLEIPYWNISQPGRSLDYIVRILNIALKRLRPDLVLILAPDPFRQEWFDIDDVAPCHTGPWLGKEFSFLQEVYQDRYMGYLYIKNLIMLELLMYEAKCDWFWGTWSLKPEHYMQDIPATILEHKWKAKFPSMSEISTNLPVARDGNHFGPITHTIFADQIFDELWPKFEMVYKNAIV